MFRLENEQRERKEEENTKKNIKKEEICTSGAAPPPPLAGSHLLESGHDGGALEALAGKFMGRTGERRERTG